MLLLPNPLSSFRLPLPASANFVLEQAFGLELQAQVMYMFKTAK